MIRFKNSKVDWEKELTDIQAYCKVKLEENGFDDDIDSEENFKEYLWYIIKRCWEE